MNKIFYPDLFILSNFIINCTLIYLSLKANKVTINISKITLAGIIGAITSLPLVFLNEYIGVIFKILLPFFMCYYPAKKCSSKLIIKLSATFWIYSLLLSGVLVSLNSSIQLFKLSVSSYGTISYTQLCCAIIAMHLLRIFIIKLLSRQTIASKHYKSVKITHNNKSISLIGYCDSGNTLIDKNSSLPVFVIAKSSITNYTHLFDVAYNIPFNTILGNGSIPIVYPDTICIDGKPIKAAIGISDKASFGDYDILLSCDEQIIELSQNINETENVYV